MTIYKHNPTPWQRGEEHETKVEILDAQGVHIATVRSSEWCDPLLDGNARLLLDAVAALKSPSPSQSSTPTGGGREATIDAVAKWWEDRPQLEGSGRIIANTIRGPVADSLRALGSPGEGTPCRCGECKFYGGSSQSWDGAVLHAPGLCQPLVTPGETTDTRARALEEAARLVMLEDMDGESPSSVAAAIRALAGAPGDRDTRAAGLRDAAEAADRWFVDRWNSPEHASPGDAIRALGSPGERDDRAAKSVRVEWEDGLYTEIRGTTARGIVQFLATMYCAPGETTDTRANVVKCVCGLTLTVACPCCGAPRGEPCKHHGSALASPSPQTHDEGDRT